MKNVSIQTIRPTPSQIARTVASLCLLLAPLGVSAQSELPLKIGILTDLTGKGAYLGLQTRVAADLLKHDLDALHQPVEFVLADHGLDAARAVTETQRLLSVEKVDAVFSNFSGPSRAISPIVQAQNKLFVYTAAAVEPVKKNPSAFKSYLDYDLGCEKLGAAWKSAGISRVGLLKAEAEFGELCLTGLLRVHPDLTVAGYTPGQDVASQVLLLKSKDVGAIAHVGYEADMENLLKALRQLKFHAQVGGNEDIYTPRLRADYAPELQEALAFGMPQPTLEFAARARAADPKNLTGGLEQLAMSYLHLSQMVSSLRTCNRALDCTLHEMLLAKSDDRFGFVRWRDDRQADFRWALTRFDDGNFKTVAGR